MIETVVLHRRHMRRYQHIVRVLMSHGLGGLIAPFDPRGVREIDDIEFDDETSMTSVRRAIHLRQAFEELGPAFVKLGQILSTRADMLSPVYIRELGKLRDRVPPVSFEEIVPVLERELGGSVDELFASFDREPIAAASIGQVHRAVLLTGETVAIKIQRPGIDHRINEDVSILQDVARIAENRSSFLRKNNVNSLVQEFGWTIKAELDYEREARNMMRYASTASKGSVLHIPKVYQEFTTSRVLTMEYCVGSAIGEDLDTPGFADSAAMVREYLNLLIRGIFELGLFHADPHPGNFAKTDNGQLIVYDFGLMGSLDDRLRERLLVLALAIVDRDAARVVDEFALLGSAPEGVDRAKLERDITHLIDRKSVV